MMVAISARLHYNKSGPLHEIINRMLHEYKNMYECNGISEEAIKGALWIIEHVKGYVEEKNIINELAVYQHLIEKYNPDGTKKKKFLGIFGGAIFTKNIEIPKNRNVTFKAEIISYQMHLEAGTFN